MKIGAFMSGHIERWFYSDSKLLQSIIVFPRDVVFYDNGGIPQIHVYLDIYNRTYYSKISINPAIFVIEQLTKLHSEGANIVDKDFTAIRFEANLSEAEFTKLKEFNALQLKNKGRGQLCCNVTLSVECDGRKLEKIELFDSLKIEGI